MRKISIIIPVYNGEEYIYRCWNSLLKQTCDNWEAIMIDDGSTDNSHLILKEIQEKYPNKCKIIHQDNQGQFAARKCGILHATGEYCMFLDIDDTFTEDAVKTIIDVIERKETDIVIFEGLRVVNNEKRLIWEDYKDQETYFNEDNKSILLKDILVGKRLNNLCFKAIKKSVCIEIPQVDDVDKVRVEEDLLMQLSWIDNAKNISYIPNKLYLYYFNESSVTNNFVPDRYIAAESVNKLLLYYSGKWNMNMYIDEINQRYYIEVCESIRQLKIYRLSIKEKIKYIIKVGNDKYFVKKYDSEKINANIKRKILLFFLRHKFWPVILLVI